MYTEYSSLTKKAEKKSWWPWKVVALLFFVVALVAVLNYSPNKKSDNIIETIQIDVDELVGDENNEENEQEIEPNDSPQATITSMQTTFPIKSIEVGSFPGTNDLILTALGYDDKLWYTTCKQGKWNKMWKLIGNEVRMFPSKPGCAGVTSTKAVCTVMADDSAVWYTDYDGKKWSEWKSLGGVVISGSSATSVGGISDVVAPGTDSFLYRRNRPKDSNSWSNWARISATYKVFGEPGCVSPATNRLDCFYQTSNGALAQTTILNGRVYNYLLGSGPTNGKIAKSSGVTAVYSPSRWTVFVRGEDNKLYYKQHYRRWGGWVSLGGGFMGTPSCVSTGPSNLYCFVKGFDNGVYGTSITPQSNGKFTPWVKYNWVWMFGKGADWKSPPV